MKKSTTPTFLLELPLSVDPGQAKRLRAHFEAARCLYNALLGEAMKRLRQMRADPAWQAARALPKIQKRERAAAFSQLRQAHGFSEYALHAFAKEANCTWIADHIDFMMAQTLATRAYQAVNRVCRGLAKKVRFKSKGRGLDSVENKWSKSGLRFLLQPPEEGNQGWLNKASSPNAQGADIQGYRYSVQLILEGIPHHKSKHTVGTDVVGLDLGPSTIVSSTHDWFVTRRPVRTRRGQTSRATATPCNSS